MRSSLMELILELANLVFQNRRKIKEDEKSSESKRNCRQQEDAVAIADAIRDLANQQKLQQEENRTNETTRNRREIFTLFFLILTAGAAITQAALISCSNNISRNAYTDVQRAFVNVSSLQIERVMENVNGQEVPYWSFTPELVNDGNTPTSDMLYLAGARVFFDSSLRASPSLLLIGTRTQLVPVIDRAPSSRTMFPVDPDSLISQKTPNFHVFLGPHGKRSQITKLEIPEDSLNWAIKHGWRSYIYGEIKYKDIFDDSREHVTQYCYLITGETEAKGFNARSVLCNYWNCSDKECKNNKTRYDQDIAKENTRYPSEPPFPSDGPTLEFE